MDFSTEKTIPLKIKPIISEDKTIVFDVEENLLISKIKERVLYLTKNSTLILFDAPF